jgi:hypothetical protein
MSQFTRQKFYSTEKENCGAPGSSSFSSSAALQPGVGFGLLYKLIPLLSISNQLFQ